MESSAAGSEFGACGIAVIGMGCIFPGNINSPEALWQFLREGRDAITACSLAPVCRAGPEPVAKSLSTAMPRPPRIRKPLLNQNITAGSNRSFRSSYRLEGVTPVY
jgi:hypothetical protein